MTLYLDTEFNGHGGDLISLALVHTSGGYFYGVVPFTGDVHPWVKEHVIPVLRRPAEPLASFRARLEMFMRGVQGEDVVADWPYDFSLLMQAMAGPSFESHWLVPCTLRLINSGPFVSPVPHNALYDAFALRDWHQRQAALVKA